MRGLLPFVCLLAATASARPTDLCLAFEPKPVDVGPDGPEAAQILVKEVISRLLDARPLDDLAGSTTGDCVGPSCLSFRPKVASGKCVVAFGRGVDVDPSRLDRVDLYFRRGLQAAQLERAYGPSVRRQLQVMDSVSFESAFPTPLTRGGVTVVVSYEGAPEVEVVHLLVTRAAGEGLPTVSPAASPPVAPTAGAPAGVKLLPLAFLFLVVAAIALVVRLVRQGRTAAAALVASLMGGLPAVAMQAGAAWLNLSMLPRGINSGAREGLALVIVYGADALWALAWLGTAGLVIGLSVARATRFGLAWWLFLLWSAASAVAFLMVVPPRI